MIAGITSVSQVDWCLTSSTAASSEPCGRFSKPVMRLRMPRIHWPPLTAVLSQPAQIQYMRVGLTNTEAMIANVAQGTMVTTIQTRCSTERTKASSQALGDKPFLIRIPHPGG